MKRVKSRKDGQRPLRFFCAPESLSCKGPARRGYLSIRGQKVTVKDTVIPNVMEM